MNSGSDGFPTQCQAPYECGNVPYTMCETPIASNTGHCRCRYGLTNSPYCNQCQDSSQSILWEYGLAYCA